MRDYGNRLAFHMRDYGNKLMIVAPQLHYAIDTWPDIGMVTGVILSW